MKNCPRAVQILGKMRSKFSLACDQFSSHEGENWSHAVENWEIGIACGSNFLPRTDVQSQTLVGSAFRVPSLERGKIKEKGNSTGGNYVL